MYVGLWLLPRVACARLGAGGVNYVVRNSQGVGRRGFLICSSWSHPETDDEKRERLEGVAIVYAAGVGRIVSCAGAYGADPPLYFLKQNSSFTPLHAIDTHDR